MPLSLQKITGRRTADSQVSKAYGGKGCAVHSPNGQRPGRLADEYRIVCHQLGFPLAPANTHVGSQPSLIEVYPHTALLKLLKLDYRFPYKISRRNRYWKNESTHERKVNLVKSFNTILAGLTQVIDGISLEIPELGDVKSFASLKRYEDALDALVCAWVGRAYLEGNCVSYGDEQAAIWSPTSNSV